MPLLPQGIVMPNLFLTSICFQGEVYLFIYIFFNHEQHDDVDVGETGRINVDKTNY